MEVRKHNARKITETFDYRRTAQEVSKELEEFANDRSRGVYSTGENDKLKGFQIAGEKGIVSLTFDERDKQQVIDLLRAMADKLDYKDRPIAYLVEKLGMPFDTPLDKVAEMVKKHLEDVQKVRGTAIVPSLPKWDES